MKKFYQTSKETSYPIYYSEGAKYVREVVEQIKAQIKPYDNIITAVSRGEIINFDFVYDEETKVIDGEIVEKPFIIFNKIEGDFRMSAQLLVNELFVQLKKKDHENRLQNIKR